MEEMSKHGKVGLASLRAGLDRKTGRKYVKRGGVPPSASKPSRDWRTRLDAFDGDWAEIAERLTDAPELEAKILLEDLAERKPEAYDASLLRTLQRRIRTWRATAGPPKEVFFAQEHVPGEAFQTDFTWMKELEITIAGEPFHHMVCHVVLPYSNWEWATVCHSESMAAMKAGVQSAVYRLGKVARFHQTDNSSSATHDIATGKRGFNADYLALMRHLAMEPRTIEIGESNQNGDIEAANGAFKRRAKQYLLLRQSRNFDTVEIYQEWLDMIAAKANRFRSKRVDEELAKMRPVAAIRMAEYRELRVGVSKWSTIRILHNAYSVPSRLIDEQAVVRVYEDHIEVYYRGTLELSCERLLGRNGHRINYRHIIWSLVQKPGAFKRYCYREELFPSLIFRQAYDALTAALSPLKADVEYLRILHLAASTMEADVERAIAGVAEAGPVPLVTS